MILDNFYSAKTDVEVIANYIAMDLILTKTLSSSLLSGRLTFHSVWLGVHASGLLAGNLRNRLPSRYTLQNALGTFWQA
ncbi:MAG: hypothetical protein PSY14_08190 [bacterium]|nr:hypothetical protein [bacterium]